MKRRQNIAAIVGFLIVVAFVVVRLLRAGATWADVREFASDLPGIGLFFLIPATILFAIVVAIWGAYLSWRAIRRRPAPERSAERYSIGTRFRLIVDGVLLSVVIGAAAAAAVITGRSNLGAPGFLAAAVLKDWASECHLELDWWFFLLPCVIDAAICFTILWCGYLLWMRTRQRSVQ